MKSLLILLAFVLNIYATIEMSTTQVDTTDVNTTKANYHAQVKHYFKTNIELGINVRKAPLKPYYLKKKYELIWFEEEKLNPLSKKLVELVQEDKILSYKIVGFLNIKNIQELFKVQETSTLSMDDTLRLDLLLTNLYDKYITYVAHGSINWGDFKKNLKELYKEDEIVANWEKYSAKVNKYKLLHLSLKTQDFAHSILSTNHNYPNSQKLYEMLDTYEELSKLGGYTVVPTVKESLRMGMSSDIIPLLKERLVQSGDLVINVDEIETAGTTDINATDLNATQEIAAQNIYDEQLVNAVKSFQRSHGLQVDGICGKDTIRHLNISVDNKIDQIRVNLERMRWMPRKLGVDYLIVNIPDYNLRYFKNDEEILKLPVVVGTKKNPTPIFSHKLSTVVLNPYWRVPKRIVQRELVPKLVRNPNYLKNQNMNIHATWDQESETFNANDIDWTQYAQSSWQKKNKIYPDIPYKFIQVPGRKNPLGKMKFMFHNKYMVYIHDTSAKHYFNRRQRAFSHGCIRVYNPYKLLKTIASEDKKLDYKKAKKILKDIEQTSIALKKRIPIHIVYLTAWLDDNNVMQFRDDIYGYDKMQKELLY